MRKGGITMTITIGIMCFILVYVMFLQFRSVEQTDITGVENMRETELKALLSSWKQKYEDANQQLQDTNTKINEYKEKTESNQEASELLKTELGQADMLLGKTNVKGEGVVVTLLDNDNYDISAYDLLKLVNELRYAGAEAISINEERIINNSDIVDIGGNYIVVNGQRLTSPYVVKAIGDQVYLESGLTAKNGYVDYIKDNEKTAKVEKQKNIQIAKFKGELKLKYIK